MLVFGILLFYLSKVFLLYGTVEYLSMALLDCCLSLKVLFSVLLGNEFKFMMLFLIASNLEVPGVGLLHFVVGDFILFFKYFSDF